MDEAIKVFEAAYKAMIEAASNLDPHVEKAIVLAKSADELFELDEKLPAAYKGRRKVIEAALRMQK